MKEEVWRRIRAVVRDSKTVAQHSLLPPSLPNSDFLILRCVCAPPFWFQTACETSGMGRGTDFQAKEPLSACTRLGHSALCLPLQAQGFHGEIEDFLLWLTRMENQLSASKPTGGLPETAREQLNAHMVSCPCWMKVPEITGLAAV